jgi:hypothetical protein
MFTVTLIAERYIRFLLNIDVREGKLGRLRTKPDTVMDNFQTVKEVVQLFRSMGRDCEVVVHVTEVADRIDRSSAVSQNPSIYKSAIALHNYGPIATTSGCS